MSEGEGAAVREALELFEKLNMAPDRKKDLEEELYQAGWQGFLPTWFSGLCLWGCIGG